MLTSECNCDPYSGTPHWAPSGQGVPAAAPGSWAEAEKVSHGAAPSWVARRLRPSHRSGVCELRCICCPRWACTGAEPGRGEGEGRRHLPGVWVSVHQRWRSQRQWPGTGKHFNETEKKRRGGARESREVAPASSLMQPLHEKYTLLVYSPGPSGSGVTCLGTARHFRIADVFVHFSRLACLLLLASFSGYGYSLKRGRGQGWELDKCGRRQQTLRNQRGRGNSSAAQGSPRSCNLVMVRVLWARRTFY